LLRKAGPVLAVGAIAVLSLGPGRALAGRPPGMGAGFLESSWKPSENAPCPTRMLPDDGVCVRLPEDGNEPEMETEAGGHHDPRGRWVAYDQIPRRPDRSSDYDAYRYPVPCAAGCVFSGYDLDRPDELQRRGPHLSHVGHGGLDMAAPRGEPVRLIGLEHQRGPAEVVYVGPLFGTTVVTRHTVLEAGRPRDYIVLFCHLEAAATGLVEHAPGAQLSEGDVVGFVGDTGSRGLVHLHLEVRRVRDGVDVNKLPPSKLVDDAETVVCDPRNVLMMR
jgi:murein DD-endopeptidase MepM/ murein hydrolase activator NlpD